MDLFKAYLQVQGQDDSEVSTSFGTSKRNVLKVLKGFLRFEIIDEAGKKPRTRKEKKDGKNSSAETN
jgi:hypothetical protein